MEDSSSTNKNLNLKSHVYFGRDMQAEALARSDTIGAIVARRDFGNRISVREKVFLFLSDPSSGSLARGFGVLMWIVVLFSTFSTCYETMRWVTDLSGPLPWLYAKWAFRARSKVQLAHGSRSLNPADKDRTFESRAARIILHGGGDRSHAHVHPIQESFQGWLRVPRHRDVHSVLGTIRTLP